LTTITITKNYSIDTVSELTRRSAMYTGHYKWRTCPRSVYAAARVGFKTSTFRTQGTEPTTPHIGAKERITTFAHH